MRFWGLQVGHRDLFETQTIRGIGSGLIACRPEDLSSGLVKGPGLGQLGTFEIGDFNSRAKKSLLKWVKLVNSIGFCMVFSYRKL